MLSEVKMLQAMTGARKLDFPMCELGHASQKLTTLMVSTGLEKSLESLSEPKCSHKTHKPAGGETENGKWTSSQAARYPTALNEALAEAIAGSQQATHNYNAREPEKYIDEYGVEREAPYVNPDLLMGP